MPTTRHDIGYHGTLDIKANAIIEQNYFIPSSKDTEWLGKGVYFFAHKQHAIDWANREASKPRNIGKASCVLSVDLDYEPSDLLDLDDPEQLQMLNDFVSASMEKLKSSETALIQTIGRAARNANGMVILYADEVTGSMERAITETERRRKKQMAYNTAHHITITITIRNHYSTFTRFNFHNDLVLKLRIKFIYQ